MADLRRADDDTIPAAEELHVRIYPAADAIKPVEGGGHCPHGGSIRGRDPNKPLSCDLSSLCTPEETRDRGTDGNFHVAVVTAATVRALGLRVIRDPVEGPIPNPAHGLILGTRPNPNNGDLEGALTTGEYSKLARVARIVRYAPRPHPPRPPG